jgi:hypothetical protein
MPQTVPRVHCQFLGEKTPRPEQTHRVIGKSHRGDERKFPVASTLPVQVVEEDGSPVAVDDVRHRAGDFGGHLLGSHDLGQ